VPGLDSGDIAAELRDRVAAELDYELEAANQRAMQRAYAGHPFAYVPAVVGELCRTRVLVSELVDGRRFDEILELDDATRSRFGEILFRFYVNGPFTRALMNGDPHPGNSLLRPDGTVAFVDFGFFKRLSHGELRVQRALLRAVYEQDTAAMRHVTREQGVVEGRADVGPVLDVYRSLCWWFMEDREITLTPEVAAEGMRAAAGLRAGGRIRLPAEQVVAMRAYLLVLAVLGRLGATANWSRLAREVLYGDPPSTDLGRADREHWTKEESE
jgi:predicted unusual protein kinase regulating ubiquinone biosynthesis (AarF/ABC1/UbiB family)